MAGDEIRVASKPLKEFAEAVFIKVGMSTEDARVVAEALIWANLRGVDSHGVLRIPWYLENIDNGVMNPKARIRVENETAATLLVEADHALGPPVTVFAVGQAVQKAKQIGIGWVLIRNHTHQGALGYYSQMIADQGMAGIVFVCSPPNMAPYGARVAGVANNPIAIAVPAKHHRPLNLDMATSVVAGGKLFLAIDKGISIPVGWALDKNGNPTTDPRQSAALLPVGGHKGSGLALMLECLGSVMVGRPLLEPVLLSKEVEPPPQNTRTAVIGVRPQHVRRNLQNSTVVAVNIDTFTDVESYEEHIDNLIDGLKALPKAEGFSEIFVPGEPEWRTHDERLRTGIPLPAQTYQNLEKVADRFALKLPEGL